MTSTFDTSARNEFAGIQALLSRAPGYSAAREALRHQSAAEIFDPQLRSADGVQLGPDAWPWYMGALAQLQVGELLAELGPRWFVRHALPVGPDSPDVDHLLIGPTGVVVLTTRCHHGATVWVGEPGMRVDGFEVAELDAAAHLAADVRERLARKVGFPVSVHSVIVSVGERTVIDARDPDARATSVISARELLDWIRGRASELSPTELELLRLAAEEPDTWDLDRHAADTLRVMPRFQRLRAQVGDDPVRPRAARSDPAARPVRMARRRFRGMRVSAAALHLGTTLLIGLVLVPVAALLAVLLLSELLAMIVTLV